VSRGLAFFATCARGVEEALAGELRALGTPGIQAERGGVLFRGTLEDAWRANLWLRTAHHVLLSLGELSAPSGDALYAAARRVSWQDHLTPRMTFAVRCTRGGRRDEEALGHTHFAALRVKDAIADVMRERAGARPSVDTRSPDLVVHLHLEGRRGRLYLDTSGDSLHRRGYRPGGSEAPLKETLAAALLLHAEWDTRMPLCDPMCGSGTILVEAALLGHGVAPGLQRRFGFERWLGFDARRYARLRAEAAAARRGSGPVLAGSDRSARAIDLARRSLRATGLDGTVAWRVCDLTDARPAAPPPGLVVCNPPYGARLEDPGELTALYGRLGDTLKQHFAGHTAFVLTGALAHIGAIGLSPSRRIVLFNGPIECRLLRFELYAGTRRA
jgi:putative N6-adenine-specific DNA methylase